MTSTAERRSGAGHAGFPAGLLLTLLLVPPVASAGNWQGRELGTVIEELRQSGLPVLYSSGLIRPGMPIIGEPAGATPVASLDHALRPYGLGIRPGPYGSLLVVRAGPDAAGVARPVPAATSVAALPDLIVTTSRYAMVREPIVPVTTLPITDVERLPDLGDDPMRALARLPGTAANGLSSRTNIRGGATDETLVTFAGLRLFNPFHLKDFQSIFSAIDPAVIEGLEVYTGAFPASFGDRLSGVVDIEPFEPPAGGYRALAASLFNVSGLAAGDWHDGRGSWLVSGRRGNLDLVLDLTDQDLGSPRYSDLHGRVAWAFTDRLSVSANALVFDDDISVFDSDVEEQANARYHDGYLWLRADVRPAEELTGLVLLSYVDLTVRRTGIADQPDISAGSLHDRRSAEVLGLASQWSLALDGTKRVDFGVEMRTSRARYSYTDEVTFELLFDTPGAPTEPTRSRDIAVEPSGEYYAAWLGGQADLPGNWQTELGLRWDRSDLAGHAGHLSPRVSLLYPLTSSTTVRASWGRYWQSQGIDELAVNDGESDFAKPERADQLVVGLEQDIGAVATLRIEAYAKDYRNPRDRYENLLNSFILLPELKPDRVRVSADSARARGIELALRSIDQGSWDWWASYTWARVQDEVDGVQVDRSWDQTHAVSAGVLWSNERWDLSAAAMARSGWPTTLAFVDDDTPPGLVSTGPRNGERLATYATLDLRAARRFPTDTGLVSVFLEITNSFNRRNYCCMEYGIDMDDTGEFEVERLRNLPILPSVGFSWQF